MALKRVLKQIGCPTSDINEAEDQLAGIQAQPTCMFAHIDTDKDVVFRVISFHEDLEGIDAYEPDRNQRIVYVDADQT